MPQKQNIHHVDHIVWVSRIENLKINIEKLEKLTRHRLRGPFDRPDLGIRLAVSFEGGVEIVAPLNEDGPMARYCHAALEKNGEGMFAVVYGVPNMEEARKYAAELGYPTGPVMESVGGEPWESDIGKFKESLVCEFMNTLFVYGEIDYPGGVFLTHIDEAPREAVPKVLENR
jgi:hypothetical protein